MKQIARVVLSLLVFISLPAEPQPAPGSSLLDSTVQGSHVPQQVVVRFSPSLSKQKKQEYIDSVNGEISGRIPALRAIILTVPRGHVGEAIEHLNSKMGVVYAEPDHLVSTDDTIPNDPGYSAQYGLPAIRAPQGWDLSTGAEWVTIAVIDSGVDLKHADLITKIIAGYDFVNDDDSPQDDNGHGTHVAGIAAAAANNAEGIAGVSWGAQIMPLKVLNASGSGSYANVATAIVYATDNGAQVINMSLGGPAYSSLLDDAVNYAYARGVVVVAAAGNTGSNNVLYPARLAPVIAVGATDVFDEHAPYSNYGPEVDLAAPGSSIYSLFPGGTYGYRTGTSMSTPFVSGLAAILIGLPGNYDAGRVEGQMESTALDLGVAGPDVYYGFGLIQMDAAISAGMPTPTPTSSPTLTSTPTLPSTPITALTPTSTSTLTSTPLRSLTPTPTRQAGSTPKFSRTSTPGLEAPPSFGPRPPVTSTEATMLPGASSTPDLAARSPSAIPSWPVSIAVLMPTPQTAEGPAAATSPVNWLLPCGGTTSILIGLLLFWVASRALPRNQLGKRPATGWRK